MNDQPKPISFTREEQDKICAILQRGSDRQTAANYCGRTFAELQRGLQHDLDFSAEVRRSEAACEFRHMECLHTAAKDEKNWRASVWWLERRAPERYGPRSANVVTARQLQTFAEGLADLVAVEVRDPQDRQRVLDAIRHLAASFTGVRCDKPKETESDLAHQAGVNDRLAETDE